VNASTSLDYFERLSKDLKSLATESVVENEQITKLSQELAKACKQIVEQCFRLQYIQKESSALMKSNIDSVNEISRVSNHYL
jgi:phosphate uptake regulator